MVMGVAPLPALPENNYMLTGVLRVRALGRGLRKGRWGGAWVAGKGAWDLGVCVN
jgi:hypothetical protein